MNNKTAMQKIIDFCEEITTDWGLSEDGNEVNSAVKTLAKMLLEEEKKQIILAYLDGQDSMDLQPSPRGIEYYEKTYQNK